MTYSLVLEQECRNKKGETGDDEIDHKMYSFLVSLMTGCSVKGFIVVFILSINYFYRTSSIEVSLTWWHNVSITPLTCIKWNQLPQEWYYVSWIFDTMVQRLIPKTAHFWERKSEKQETGHSSVSPVFLQLVETL